MSRAPESIRPDTLTTVATETCEIEPTSLALLSKQYEKLDLPVLDCQPNSRIEVDQGGAEIELPQDAGSWTAFELAPGQIYSLSDEVLDIIEFTGNVTEIETGNPFTGETEHGIFVGAEQCRAIFLTGTEETSDPPVLRLEYGDEVDVQSFLDDFLANKEAGRDYYSAGEQETLSAIEILVPAVGAVCAERVDEVGALQIGSLTDLEGGPGPGEIWRVRLVEGETIRLGGSLQGSEFLYVEDDLLVMYPNGGLVAFEEFFSTANATVLLGLPYGISSDIAIARIDPRASDQDVKLLQVAVAEESAPSGSVVAEAEPAIEGEALVGVEAEEILAGSGGDDSLRGDPGDDRLSEGELTQGQARNLASPTMDGGGSEEGSGDGPRLMDPNLVDRSGGISTGHSALMDPTVVERDGGITAWHSALMDPSAVERDGGINAAHSALMDPSAVKRDGGRTPESNGLDGPMIASGGSEEDELSLEGNGSAGRVIRLGDVLDTSTESEVATAAVALDQLNGTAGTIGSQPTVADTSVALAVAPIDIASLIGAADDPSNDTPVV